MTPFGLQFDTLSLILFAVIGILLIVIWQFTDDNGFDIKAIIIDSRTKQVSLMKLGQLVALCISSWAFLHETRAGRLSEWLFIGYMTAWSGANLLNKWIASKNEERRSNFSQRDVSNQINIEDEFDRPKDRNLSDRDRY